MANKKVIGELVYEIKGDDSQYSNVINRADQQTENLGKTMTKQSGTINGLITNLAGAYLGYQGITKALQGTIGEAINYESAFAGVRKTVNGTEEELQALSAQFIDLSKSMPVSAEEFAKIGELAGQLGVPIQNIADYAKTIAMVGTATNLTTEQAATDFARFANITQMPLEEISNLGSAIVNLGNNMATTESEIDAMALRIAGAGATIGLTQPEILAWAAALSSVGIEAEAGGSAISRLMVNVGAAVSSGGKDLGKFAKVAGLTSDQFKKKFKEDANGALNEFFKGLQKVQEGGGDTLSVLESLGITEVRQRDAVLRLANAGDVLNEAMDISAEGFSQNNALQTEAEKRYKTTASQIQILKNNWADLGRQLGTVILPIVNLVIEFFRQMAQTVVFVVDGVKTAILYMGTNVVSRLQNLLKGIEGFINGAIDLANKALSAFGKDETIKHVTLSFKALDDAVASMKDKTKEAAKETANAFFAVGEGAFDASTNAKKLSDAQTLLKGGASDASAEIEDLVNGLKDDSEASKKAQQEAEKLEERWKKLKDETIDLSDKGVDALKDLANENVKDLEKIEDKIKDLRDQLAQLKSDYEGDILSEDKGMAEKIVDEQNAIAEIKNKIAEEQAKITDEAKNSSSALLDMEQKLEVLRKRQSEQTSKTSDSARLSLRNEIDDLVKKIAEAKSTDSGSAGSTLADLQKELETRQAALASVLEQNQDLTEQISEAQRRASLTDLERAQEDYLAKKAQILQEYEDKKADLEAKLALEEQNKADTIALYQDKQDQINAIIELGNQRFKDLADNRVKITEDEVSKQIRYYNQLADAIARSKSATRTTELPQFASGGYVASGGEVHAGEYVIPANMVARYGGLVKALEGIRTGASNSNTVNNNISMNNVINEQIDMDAVLKNMSFELNK